MNSMAPNKYVVAINRALEKQGGFFALEDIVAGFKTGEYQSWALGESWAATRIMKFPRKPALELVFMVGVRDELRVLEGQIVEFMRENGIRHIFAFGRIGLARPGVAFEGWVPVLAYFMKEIDNG